MVADRVRSALRGRHARFVVLALVVTSFLVTAREIVGPSPLYRTLGVVLTFTTLVEGVVRAAVSRRGIAIRLLRASPELVAGVTLVLPVAAVPSLLLLRLARAGRLFPLLEPSVRHLGPGTRAVLRAGLASAIAVTAGALALYVFEAKVNPSLASPDLAGWSVLYSMVAGEPIPVPPTTWGGRLTLLAVIAVGLGGFATVAGTAGALVSETIRKRGTMVDWEDLEGHIVLCGWNRKAELIVRELVNARRLDVLPVVAISDADAEPAFADASLRARVQFLNADFTEVASLERAGIRRAARCILVCDTSRGRSERDADARTILAALTIERLSSAVYTCAEVHSRDHVPHLKMGNVNEIVIGGEHSAFLLAQAALHKGIVSVFHELMTLEYGNSFRSIPIPKRWLGRSFRELLVHLKDEHDALLVGVLDSAGKCHVNPTNHEFASGEAAVVIASDVLALERE